MIIIAVGHNLSVTYKLDRRRSADLASWVRIPPHRLVRVRSKGQCQLSNFFLNNAMWCFWLQISVVALQFTYIKAKQRCVMGVGMCLYAQLVQTKNKQCKSAIIIQ